MALMRRTGLAPGKTPLSAMTPTIVLKDGKPVLALGSPGGPTIINSVLEVIAAARQVTGRDIRMHIEPRRPGDPAHLIAKADRAREIMGWQPAHPELADIIRSAWQWRQAHPSGYAD